MERAYRASEVRELRQPSRRVGCRVARARRLAAWPSTAVREAAWHRARGTAGHPADVATADGSRRRGRGAREQNAVGDDRAMLARELCRVSTVGSAAVAARA